MNSKKIRKIAALLLAALVLTYVGYQVMLSFRKGVTTEAAMYASVSDTVQTNGFVIRNETVIEDSYQGVLNYQVADGVRVAQNGEIAQIFSNEEDAAAMNSMERIDQEIASLEAMSSPSDFYATNPSMVGTQIFNALTAVTSASMADDMAQFPALKANLQTALTRKQLTTGEENVADYQARIQLLESEKAQLEASAQGNIGSISSPAAGYFISLIDGLERAVDINKVDSLTPEEITALLAMETGEGTGGKIGKICGDFNWYLAAVLSENEMIKLENIQSVHLEIPFAGAQRIPATIVAKNYSQATKETAVILECSYMDSDIALVRNEPVRIIVKTYSGVLVNENAIRFADVEYTTYDENDSAITQKKENVKGVYVEYGGKLEFVQIFTDKTINGYAICKLELNEEEQQLLVTDHTIQLYDQVVVEGTDLYDGKLTQ